MVILNGTEMPDLIIEDEFGWTGVAGSADKTIMGGTIINEGPVSNKPIDLVGSTDTAWMTRAQLISIRDLAAIVHGIFTLSYEGVVRRVRFRSEDAPVISAQPLIPRPNQETADYYNEVRIKLMEV